MKTPVLAIQELLGWDTFQDGESSYRLFDKVNGDYNSVESTMNTIKSRINILETTNPDYGPISELWSRLVLINGTKKELLEACCETKKAKWSYRDYSKIKIRADELSDQLEEYYPSCMRALMRCVELDFFPHNESGNRVLLFVRYLNGLKKICKRITTSSYADQMLADQILTNRVMLGTTIVMATASIIMLVVAEIDLLT